MTLTGSRLKLAESTPARNVGDLAFLQPVHALPTPRLLSTSHKAASVLDMPASFNLGCVRAFLDARNAMFIRISFQNADMKHVECVKAVMQFFTIADSTSTLGLPLRSALRS